MFHMKASSPQQSHPLHTARISCLCWSFLLFLSFSLCLLSTVALFLFILDEFFSLLFFDKAKNFCLLVWFGSSFMFLFLFSFPFSFSSLISFSFLFFSFFFLFLPWSDVYRFSFLRPLFYCFHCFLRCCTIGCFSSFHFPACFPLCSRFVFFLLVFLLLHVRIVPLPSQFSLQMSLRHFCFLRLFSVASLCPLVFPLFSSVFASVLYLYFLHFSRVV